LRASGDGRRAHARNCEACPGSCRVGAGA